MEKNLTEKIKYNTNVPRLVLSISYIAEMIAVLVLTMLFKFSDVLEFEFGSGVITSDFGYFLSVTKPLLSTMSPFFTLFAILHLSF